MAGERTIGKLHLPAILVEILILLTATASMFVLRMYFFQPGQIISGSMEPALRKGDRIFYSRIQGKYTPRRGDIVSIRYDEEYMVNNEELIKRVVGLPGEEIGIFNNHVYINGKQLEESYIKEKMEGDAVAYRIPEGMFFAMGDNRNRSEDSRMWGPLSVKYVQGRVRLIYWPFSRLRFFR